MIQASSYRALFYSISLVKEILTPPFRMTVILFPLLLPSERERMGREGEREIERGRERGR